VHNGCGLFEHTSGPLTYKTGVIIPGSYLLFAPLGIVVKLRTHK